MYVSMLRIDACMYVCMCVIDSSGDVYAGKYVEDRKNGAGVYYYTNGWYSTYTHTYIYVNKV
jgi:hypothetical protein